MDMNITMPSGYRLLANYKNLVVLAEAKNKETPEPYVTWLVVNGSDVQQGKYFVSLEKAQSSFCSRAFGLEPVAIVDIDYEVMQKAIYSTFSRALKGDLYKHAAQRNDGSFEFLLDGNIPNIAQSVIALYQRILHEIINVNSGCE